MNLRHGSITSTLKDEVRLSSDVSSVLVCEAAVADGITTKKGLCKSGDLPSKNTLLEALLDNIDAIP